MAGQNNIVRGLDVLIKVAGNVVGGQRNASLEMSAESIDVTSKSNYGWSDNITAVKSWSVALDGVLFLDDTGLKALESAFLSGDYIELEFSNAQGEIAYSGEAIVTSISYEASKDDVVSYSISVQGNKELKIGREQDEERGKLWH